MTATVASPSQIAGLQPTGSDRDRWLALVVLCVGMLMIILDSTIVNVALPSIQAIWASHSPAWPGWRTPI